MFNSIHTTSRMASERVKHVQLTIALTVSEGSVVSAMLLIVLVVWVVLVVFVGMVL